MLAASACSKRLVLVRMILHVSAGSGRQSDRESAVHAWKFANTAGELVSTADLVHRRYFEPEIGAAGAVESSTGMAHNAREEDRMARLRKRAEMEPSDEEGSDQGGGEEGSDTAGSGGGDDGWDDEEGDEHEPSMGPSSVEQESIGDRLSKLAHGSGPSRRKRHLREESEQTPAAARSNAGARRDIADDRKKGGDGVGPSRVKAPSRANKNRPQEASSLRAVGRFREVVASKRKTARDPRFEGGGGSSKLNYDIFRKAYGFLGDYQDSEIEELKKSLKKEKNQERSARLQALLTRLQQERAERSQGDRTRNAIREAKKKERDAVAGGKKPFFLKGSEKKRLSLEQRYEGLKQEGKLSKFMEKKRKKNAAKDHRWLPSKRQNRG
eukprot:g3488.t1